ncbi:MAG TPA: stage III sporulation protein AG [Candidatus Blautia merdavium]|uniref:Stage III sporulation protein AG n=1 Tax=Candidatus Blautia merdavium TaxID=2838494 RepID=A0A9D2PPK0_9FIRM|nr:stage III sporulation protein AG [Candidatus Blautia merdavium]
MKPLQELMKKEKLAVILLTGLLLLIVALPVREEDKEEEQTLPQKEQEAGEQDWQEKMEARLTKVLEQVEGVGKTEVFLTCEGTEQKVVEKDENSTVYEKDAKGNQSPYVTTEVYPRVTGVLVVAQGGGDPVTVQKIQEAVEALFQVEAHKIKVMKMN